MASVKRSMNRILGVDAGGRVRVLFVGNYAKKTSFWTIMGPLYMTRYVCHDEDRDMDSFLRKLYASLVCNADT